MTSVRERSKSEIERLLPFGNRQSAFEVWINEPSEAVPADDSWFEESLEQARDADIVIALFSGDPGSVLPGRGQGVCHAELDEARTDTPVKVRIIDVRGALADDPPDDAEAEAFTATVEALHLMTGQRPVNDREIVAEVLAAVAAATARLALHGIVEARRGAKSLGDALDWRRHNFHKRKDVMEEVVLRRLEKLGGFIDTDRRHAVIDVDGDRLLAVVSAAPEGLSLASSRELIGQPQRDDHRLIDVLDRHGAIGPIHVIAVPAGASASQARALIGAPDVMTAVSSAGLWVADRIDRSQVLVIRDCANPSSTNIRVDQAFDWLRTSGEMGPLVKRARRRTDILRVISEDDDLS
jgi:hypothetical protein